MIFVAALVGWRMIALLGFTGERYARREDDEVHTDLFISNAPSECVLRWNLVPFLGGSGLNSV